MTGPDGRVRSLALPADATAPGVARAYVGELSVGLDPDLVDRAILLTSEVVTNAVRYGKPDIVLSVALDRLGLEISVLDHGEQLPEVRESLEGLATGGRGMPIVEALATRWGFATTHPPPGKVVWFRVEG